MQCPYCGKEMTKGFIGAESSRVSWTFWLEHDYLMKHTFLPVTKKKMQEAGGYVIPFGNGINTAPNTFYVCRDCGKMIGDVKTEP